MNCLITGAAGFIGSHLCDLLLAQGHKVFAVDDLSMGRVSNLTSASKSSSFTFIQQNILELSPKEFPESIDWIFHLAGRADLIPSIQEPGDYFKTNVEGTFRVLELARTLSVKRFIYTASSTCYGKAEVVPTPETFPCDPRHPYGLTKYLGEQMVMHWATVYKLPALSLRLFNVYGPRSRTTGAYGAVFGVFLKQKLAGQPFTVVGDGLQTRDFTYVSDVAAAFISAAQSSVSCQYLNVGSGGTYSIKRLVELLGGDVTYLPKRPGEPDCTFADTTKIKKLLGWHPTVSFEDGVSNMLSIIEDWRDAPLWDASLIEGATKEWFRFLKQYEV